MSEISETEIKAMTKEQNYLRGYKDGKSDVLDKLRTEITYKQEIELKGEETSEWNECIKEVLEVIDKYKLESEEVE